MYEFYEIIDEVKSYINDILKLNIDPVENREALAKVILQVNSICENLSKNIDDNYKRILEVCRKITLDETIVSDDNLKSLYEKLDKIQAEKNIEDEISQDDVEIEYDADDVAIKYMQSLNIKDDSILIINSLSEYTNFISTLSLSYLSRGQKDYTFELLPSSLRRMDGQLLYDSKEIRIMREEFRISLKYFDNRFEHLNDLELEAYAQHYGIPTYLIDFTEAHFISLLWRNIHISSMLLYTLWILIFLMLSVLITAE